MAKLATLTELSDNVIKAIDGAIDNFGDSLPGVQERLFKEILQLIKELDVRGDQILNNVRNINIISRIKSRIERIVLNDQYIGNVRKFVDSFAYVDKLNIEYFRAISARYKAPGTVAIVRKIAVDATIDSLMESGIEANLSGPIRDIISRNVTTGGSYASLTEQLREYIIGSKDVEGRLIRYSRQITTDAINQYNANANQIIATDLGLEWYMYVGSNITTTRPFCKALTNKLYVHKSELAEIAKGVVDGTQIPVYEKTGLPHGMIPGTDASNIKINRGGYNCRHQLMPVPAEVVPIEIRRKFSKAA